MGSDPASLMANLFLYYYENKWPSNIKKRDLQKAHPFGNLFRFIVHSCPIKDQLEFDQIYKDIYPLNLKLRQKSISTSETSFLDPPL